MPAGDAYSQINSGVLGGQKQPAQPAQPSKNSGGLDHVLRNVWKFALAGPIGYGMIKGGGSSTPSTPVVPPNTSQEDILSGKVPVTHIDTNSNDFKKLQSSDPGLAKAISDRQNYEYSQLTNKYLNPNQTGTISPAAIQLLFSNSINPLLQSLNQQQQGTNSEYSGLMGQLAKSLPAPYAHALGASIPLQQNLNNQVANAQTASLAQQPVLNTILDQLTKDYQQQQKTAADVIRYGTAGGGGTTDLASLLAATATGA